MSFLKKQFGRQADLVRQEGDGAEPGELPATDSGKDWDDDFMNDYLALQEKFYEIESDLRHFIDMSRASSPTEDYQVVVQNLKAIDAFLECLEDFVIHGSWYSLPGVDDLEARRGALIGALTDLGADWERERQRHVDAANRKREELEKECRQLRNETAAIRRQSHREVSQMYLDLLKSQNAKFKRQQEKLRKAIENPYYTYELDD